MKQNNKKALLAALLALVMCLGLLPFGALAEEAAPALDSPTGTAAAPALAGLLTEASVPAELPPVVEAEAPAADGVVEVAQVVVTGVSEPVTGQPMSFEYTIPQGVIYEKYNSVDDSPARGTWCETDAAPTSYDDLANGKYYHYAEGEDAPLFQPGKYYTFLMDLIINSDNDCFLETTTATVNGNAARFVYSIPKMADVWYTVGPTAVPEPTEIESVVITGVTAPVAGQEASFGWTLPTDANYLMDDSDGSGGSAWIVTDTAPADWDAMVPSDDVQWYFASGYDRGEDDKLVFEAGKYYTFMIYLKSVEGAAFASGVPATINGNTAGTQEYGHHLELVIWHTFALPAEGGSTAPTEIESVVITGVTEPVLGKEIGFDFSVPADAGYEPDVEECGCMGEWLETDWPLESFSDIEDAYDDSDAEEYYFCQNPDSNPATFKAGCYYTYIAWVKPTDGNGFSDTLTATMNSRTAMVEEYPDYYAVAYCFGPVESGDEIGRVDVTGVVEPVLGAEASFNWAVPAGTDYKKWYDPDDPYNCLWSVTDSVPSDYYDLMDGTLYYENWGDTLSFEAGKYYSFLVWVEADEGFCFERGCMSTLNGVTAETADYAYDDYIYLAVWYTFGPLSDTATDPVEIDQVDILGVTAPVAGAKASFAFSIPEDAPYRVITDDGITSSAWLETAAPVTSADELDDAFSSGNIYYDTATFNFQAGKYYTFVARTAPKAGNSYADEVSGTMNGLAAGIDILGSDEVDVFYCFAPAGAAEPIDTITVTNVMEPVDGLDLDYDFDLPAGVGYEAFVDSYGDAAAWVKSDTVPTTLAELRDDDDEWFFLNDGGYDEFEEGYYYTFVAQLTPKSGQSFSPDATATINGKDAHVDVYVDFWDDAGGTDAERFVWRTFAVGEFAGEEITKLEVLNVTAPVAGEAADFGWSVPGDANYTRDVDSDGDDCAWVVTDAEPKSWDDVNDGEWYYASGWGRADEDTIVFEEGKYYTFVAWLKPVQDYVFGEDIAAYMNGEEAGIDYDLSSASIYRTFTVEKDGGEGGGGNGNGGSKPQKPAEVPGTGDGAMPGLWLALTLLAAGGLTGLSLRRKKAKN